MYNTTETNKQNKEKLFLSGNVLNTTKSPCPQWIKRIKTLKNNIFSAFVHVIHSSVSKTSLLNHQVGLSSNSSTLKSRIVTYN